jgi:CRP-like cAMP-binding protein
MRHGDSNQAINLSAKTRDTVATASAARSTASHRSTRLHEAPLLEDEDEVDDVLLEMMQFDALTKRSTPVRNVVRRASVVAALGANPTEIPASNREREEMEMLRLMSGNPKFTGIMRKCVDRFLAKKRKMLERRKTPALFRVVTAASGLENRIRVAFAVPSNGRTEEDINLLLTQCVQPFEFSKKYTDQQQQYIAKVLKTEHYQQNQPVFRINDAGDKMYFVRSGKVQILAPVRNPDGHEHYEVLGELGPGAAFGEYAVIRRSNRTATVLAREVTQLFVIDRIDYLPLVPEAELNTQNETIKLLGKIPMFAGMTWQQLEKIAVTMTKVEYALESNSPEVIARQGDPASSMFIVLRGTVHLMIRVGSDKLVPEYQRSLRPWELRPLHDVYGNNLVCSWKPQVLQLAAISDGGIFGEEALFPVADAAETVYVASAIAKTGPVLLGVLSGSKVIKSLLAMGIKSQAVIQLRQQIVHNLRRRQDTVLRTAEGFASAEGDRFEEKKKVRVPLRINPFGDPTDIPLIDEGGGMRSSSGRHDAEWLLAAQCGLAADCGLELEHLHTMVADAVRAGGFCESVDECLEDELHRWAIQCGTTLKDPMLREYARLVVMALVWRGGESDLRDKVAKVTREMKNKVGRLNVTLPFPRSRLQRQISLTQPTTTAHRNFINRPKKCSLLYRYSVHGAQPRSSSSPVAPTPSEVARMFDRTLGDTGDPMLPAEETFSLHERPFRFRNQLPASFERRPSSVSEVRAALALQTSLEVRWPAFANNSAQVDRASITFVPPSSYRALSAMSIQQPAQRAATADPVLGRQSAASPGSSWSENDGSDGPASAPSAACHGSDGSGLASMEDSGMPRPTNMARCAQAVDEGPPGDCGTPKWAKQGKHATSPQKTSTTVAHQRVLDMHAMGWHGGPPVGKELHSPKAELDAFPTGHGDARGFFARPSTAPSGTEWRPAVFLESLSTALGPEPSGIDAMVLDAQLSTGASRSSSRPVSRQALQASADPTASARDSKRHPDGWNQTSVVLTDPVTQKAKPCRAPERLKMQDSVSVRCIELGMAAPMCSDGGSGATNAGQLGRAASAASNGGRLTSSPIKGAGHSSLRSGSPPLKQAAGHVAGRTVRIRGLPWYSTEHAVRDFISGAAISRSSFSIRMDPTKSKAARTASEALILLEHKADVSKALGLSGRRLSGFQVSLQIEQAG